MPKRTSFSRPRACEQGAIGFRKIAKKIAEATAFVLLVGEEGARPRQVTEYYEALDRRVKEANFPIVLVLLDGELAPGVAVSAPVALDYHVGSCLGKKPRNGDRRGGGWRWTPRPSVAAYKHPIGAWPP